MVRGDAEELRTVVTNLLDNAVKYSGEAVRVTVAVAAPSPDTVWVRVQDRGVGIPRKQLKRIFRRFYRVQTRGLEAGQGHRPRPLHRPLDRARARRPRLRAERGRGTRRDVHARTAAAHAARPTPASIEPHPRRRRRAAHRRRPSLQPRGRRPRRDRRDATASRRSRCILDDRQRVRRRRPRRDASGHVTDSSVATALRAAGQFVPILMLTARNRPEDVLQGIRSGRRRLPAEAVRARHPDRAHQRAAAAPPLERTPATAPGQQPSRAVRATSTRSRGRTLDFTAMEVRARGKSYRLTLMECDLLRYLVAHAGPAGLAPRAPRGRLGPGRGAPTRGPSTTSSCACGGISKIGPARRAILQTVRGVGYKFVPDGRFRCVEADLGPLLADLRDVEIRP